MENTTKEMLISTIQDRIMNATCLAEIICKAAYGQKINMIDVGASCEVLREYLDKTSELTDEFWNKEEVAAE